MATTPGPWQVVVANDGDIYVCGGEPREDGLNPICCVGSGSETEDNDARLLAAAPDLRAVLQELVDATPTPLHNRRQLAAWEAAYNLLAGLKWAEEMSDER